MQLPAAPVLAQSGSKQCLTGSCWKASSSKPRTHTAQIDLHRCFRPARERVWLREQVLLRAHSITHLPAHISCSPQSTGPPATVRPRSQQQSAQPESDVMHSSTGGHDASPALRSCSASVVQSVRLVEPPPDKAHKPALIDKTIARMTQSQRRERPRASAPSTPRLTDCEAGQCSETASPSPYRGILHHFPLLVPNFLDRLPRLYIGANAVPCSGWTRPNVLLLLCPSQRSDASRGVQHGATW